MKGILGVVGMVFKYGMGVLIGVTLITLAVCLFFVVLGLIAALFRRRKNEEEKARVKAVLGRIEMSQSESAVSFLRKNEL